MYTPQANLASKHIWVIGLGLLSVVLPLTAIIPRQALPASFTNPANLSDYRLTVAALLLGLACGIGALVASRRAPAAGVRRLSVVLASAGLLFSVWLLWTLVGSCGVQVLWVSCNP